MFQTDYLKISKLWNFD